MPKVSVIIIHWDTPELLEKQLEELKPSKDIEIIVVDNFSSEETTKKLKNLSRLPAKQLIFNDKNLGFAKAGNIGAKQARGEWLLFLNPDVSISNGQISEFIKNVEEAGFDAAAPATRNPRYNKPLPAPLSLFIEFTPLKHIIPLSMFKPTTLLGGCLLIKKSVFNTIHGWDEDFFLWFEDSDLTKRLIDNGYKVGRVPVDFSHPGGW